MPTEAERRQLAAIMFTDVVGTTRCAPRREDEALPRAREAAEKALQLDPSLAEAHTWLGFVRWWYDRDHAAARREFQTALTLQPNNGIEHTGYGW